MKGGSSCFVVGWSNAYLVLCSNKMDYLSITDMDCEFNVCPSAKCIAVFLHDVDGDAVLC
jgi:hypothetical protein